MAFISALVLTTAVAAAAPTVLWGASPVLPGERLVLAVSGISATNATSATSATPPSIETRQGATGWERATVVAGTTDYGCTIVVPASYTAGCFQVRASSSDSGYTVNAPRPWFAFGDQGSTATPGGSIRVVGDAITIQGHGAMLRLTPKSGNPTVLPVGSL